MQPADLSSPAGCITCYTEKLFLCCYCYLIYFTGIDEVITKLSIILALLHNWLWLPGDDLYYGEMILLYCYIIFATFVEIFLTLSPAVNTFL
jgi:hypothetical protein